MISLAAAPRATAGEVVLVVSAHTGPFFEAAQAFEQTFHQERTTDTLVMLEPGQPFNDANVVVVMDTKLAASLIDIDVPLIHCMALHAPSGAAALVLAYSIEDQLQLVRKVVPRATRVGVVYSDDHSAQIVEQARSLVEGYGLKLIDVRISGPAELSRALNGLANRVDILWGVPDLSLYTPATSKAVLVIQFRQRVPFIGLNDTWVQGGAAMGPSFDPVALGGQCAQIAGELLDGTPVSEIGIRKPQIMPYAINLHSLEEMNVAVTPSVIDEARYVY